IVAQVKGRIIDQGAYDHEILDALNGLTFDYGHNKYQLSCNYIWTAPCPWVLKDHLNTNQSLFVSYDADIMRHMVVVHQATFIEGAIWDSLHYVVIFDPANGQNRVVDADTFYRDAKTCMSISITVVE